MERAGIRAVVFDVGGTLLTYQETPASTQRYLSGTMALFRERGVSLSMEPDALMERIRTGEKRYKRWSEQELTELDPERIWSEFVLPELDVPPERMTGLGEELSFLYDLERREITFRPGLKETLETLRQRGYRLGVISNVMSRSFAPHILKEGGVLDLFDDVQLSSDCRIRKPHPAIFQRSLQALGLEPGQAIYVGDTISRDVLGAQAAHWPIIQIDNPGSYYHDTDLMGKYHPDARILELRELPDLVEHWPPAVPDSEEAAASREENPLCVKPGRKVPLE